MPKEILCPICGASYNLDDAQLGRKVRCKKCEHTFTAGGEKRDDEEEEDDRRGRSKAKKARDDDDDRSKKTKALKDQVKPRGERSSEGSGLPVSSFVIMGIVVAVILICGGGIGLYFLLPKDKTPTTKQQSNPPNKQPNKR